MLNSRLLMFRVTACRDDQLTILQTMQDAMKFPIIGSAILLGLFLLFKFLPKELVNRVLTLYFVLLGLLAVTSTLCPFITMLLPADWAKREVKLPSITIPYFLKVLL